MAGIQWLFYFSSKYNDKKYMHITDRSDKLLYYSFRGDDSSLLDFFSYNVLHISEQHSTNSASLFRFAESSTM